VVEWEAIRPSGPRPALHGRTIRQGLQPQITLNGRPVVREPKTEKETGDEPVSLEAHGIELVSKQVNPDAGDSKGLVSGLIDFLHVRNGSLHGLGYKSDAHTDPARPAHGRALALTSPVPAAASPHLPCSLWQGLLCKKTKEIAFRTARAVLRLAKPLCRERRVLTASFRGSPLPPLLVPGKESGGSAGAPSHHRYSAIALP
jgi:hypothetical protein